MVKIEFDIPVPSWFELTLAKVFGKKYQGQCMDSCIRGYKWRSKFYITKQWADENWREL